MLNSAGRRWNAGGTDVFTRGVTVATIEVYSPPGYARLCHDKGCRSLQRMSVELQWAFMGMFMSFSGWCCIDARSIYKEIGPGKRVALSKLAVEKFEETGRPLRIAIDTSIWLFQIQASKGMSRYLCAALQRLTTTRWH